MEYRKKPVIVDAVRWDGKNLTEMSDCIGHEGFWHKYGQLFIRTLEGTMTAEAGDWIIKGVKGEFYPCKPDIFAATYEAVEPRFTAEDQKELEDGVIAEIDKQNAHIEKTGELQGPGMTEKEKVLAKTLIQVHVLTRGYGAKMWAGVLNLIEHNGADAILSEYADEQYTGSIEKLTKLQEKR